MFPDSVVILSADKTEMDILKYNYLLLEQDDYFTLKSFAIKYNIYRLITLYNKPIN